MQEAVEPKRAAVSNGQTRLEVTYQVRQERQLPWSSKPEKAHSKQLHETSWQQVLALLEQVQQRLLLLHQLLESQC